MPPMSTGKLFAYLVGLPDGSYCMPSLDTSSYTISKNHDNYNNNQLLPKITEIVNRKEQFPHLIVKLENVVNEYENNLK